MKTHPEHLLARAADGALTSAERHALDAHLEVCAECRDALEAQRLVAQALVARAPHAASPDFSARVSARLDRERDGILELANWRAWTAGLVPVAAALVVAAYLGVGTATTTTSESVAASASDTATFESWASASAGATPAAVFLQPSASGDQLLETVLTGAAPSTPREPSDVR
jgi:predicted anti-sigma-YlaC factor YlaD